MTTFLLIRHAAHALGGGILAGRSPGVHLSEFGRRQADDLAERLWHLPIAAIYSSPMDRTQETAAPLAGRLGLKVGNSDPLIELDFGEWTRRPVDELRSQQAWRAWNEFRSGTRIPGGELMSEVQLRIIREMHRLREAHPNQCVALFSHGDVIRAGLAHTMGVALDLFQRIEISLASVSAVAIGNYGPWILTLNNTGRIQLPDAG